MTLMRWFKRDKESEINIKMLEARFKYHEQKFQSELEDHIKVWKCELDIVHRNLRSIVDQTNERLENLVVRCRADELIPRLTILENDVMKLKAEGSTFLRQELDRVRAELQVVRQISDGYKKTNDSLSDQLREAKSIADHNPPAPYLPLGVSAKSIRLDDLGLSLRVYNMLKNEGIKTVSDLCKYTEVELRKIDRFGMHALFEVVRILKRRGLKLRE